MLKVGITGGIGSGKTTVCKIFEALEVPVYYADDRAKWLMTHDPELIAGIKAAFGPDAYSPEGQLNRPYLSKVVFENNEKLAQLNALVHPAVFRDGSQWHQAQTGVPYTLREAALLFESGSYRAIDKMIVVTAPLALRINRVMERDKVSEAAVLARIEKQWPEEEKVKRADFVIVNDGERLLVPQVLEIHRALILSQG
ncbi:MAG: dephospho-CoA kinase [Saprospiraceae bacterium]|nr:dephospho-CoA kinase [Saprospiraceae bacterium]